MRGGAEGARFTDLAGGRTGGVIDERRSIGGTCTGLSGI